MNRRIAIVLLILLAIIIGFAVFQFTRPAPASHTATPVGSGTALPGSAQAVFPVSTTSVATAIGRTMTITAYGNVPLTVNDFIDNGVTKPDPMNPGRYILAGALGFCPPNDTMQCQAFPSTDFSVFYDSDTQAFTVGLLAEPLGQSRKEAEQFLLKTLGITQSQLCMTSYYVGTTYEVNPLYDAGNLGFSFCPGATQLPQ